MEEPIQDAIFDNMANRDRLIAKQADPNKGTPMVQRALLVTYIQGETSNEIFIWLGRKESAELVWSGFDIAEGMSIATAALIETGI